MLVYPLKDLLFYEKTRIVGPSPVGFLIVIFFMPVPIVEASATYEFRTPCTPAD